MFRLKLKIGRKRLGFFYYWYSGKFDYSFILPWALRDYSLLPEASAVDFMVLVGWPHQLPSLANAGDTPPQVPLPQEFMDFKGLKFTLCGEPGGRYHPVENCYHFTNGPRADDPARTRYCPNLGYWCPPLEADAKTKLCSVIESGKWAWRVDMIRKLAEQIGEVHLFGRATGQPLGGYHADDPEATFGTSKHLGMLDFAFYLAIESFKLVDYWTEKIGDATLCQAVPIYHGAPNIHDYYIPESLVLAEDVAKIDWNNWPAEYARRQRFVLMQKEILRTKFNTFAYFNLLTDDLARLDATRPILR